MINKNIFILKKNNEPNTKCVCRTPELIENYDKAIADKTQTWVCHHRLESCFSQKFLKQIGLYYDVEPKALIFLTIADHNALESKCRRASISSKGKKMSLESREKMSEAHKGKPTWNKGKHCSEETKKKISEHKKGKKMSDEFRKKCSERNKGTNNPMYGKPSVHKGRHWKTENGKRIYFD